MTATLLAQHAGASVYHATWEALLAHLVATQCRDDETVCDAVITDTPYSEATHSGHADGAQTANRALEWAKKNPEAAHSAEVRYALSGGGERRKINYAPWTPEDVHAFVEAWSPRTRGWFVAMTDHVLGPAWEAALKAQERYVFSPLAYVAPGSRVRMVGDGPAQWSCWIIVARWRTAEAAAWRALPGAYVLPPGEGMAGKKRMDVVGGKPLWLGRELNRDYSNRGDTVIDPCTGGGTFIRAAQQLGRIGIGGDQMEEHARMAAELIAAPVESMLF